MSEQSNYQTLKTAIDRGKKAAGEKAVEYIRDGMVLGLGSGSTVYWALKKLSERVKQGLNIIGIPSSRRTENWAKAFGIPLTDFEEVQEIDLSIDGADEIDGNFHLLKGGGGSLVREKIVNASAKQVIIIADRSKQVSVIGGKPLPVEVLPFGWQVTAQRINQLGGSPHLRRKDGQPFVSDNGNYIFDCSFGRIEDPETLHKQIKQLTGVVETGLFIHLTDQVILGHDEKMTILVSPHRKEYKG